MRISDWSSDVCSSDLQGADAIAAFLDHDGGIAGGADQGADTVEVAGPVGPGAGRIAARGVEAEGDDEMGRIVSLDAGERHSQRIAVLLRRDALRQRDVH